VTKVVGQTVYLQESMEKVYYPVEKVACYLSDDGGALLTFEALC